MGFVVGWHVGCGWGADVAVGPGFRFDGLDSGGWCRCLPLRIYH